MDPQGRRLPKSKIQELGVEELVDQRLRQNFTYEDITKEVKELTGEDISHSAIWRHNNRLRRAAERVKRIESFAKRIVDEAKDNRLDMVDFAGKLLLPRLIEAVADIPDEKLEALTPDQLALMIKRLSDAGVSREKFRVQFDKGFGEAEEAILAEMKTRLGARPELLAEMQSLVRQAADVALAETNGVPLNREGKG